MTAQPSGFLYPQDLPDAIQRLKRATAGDQRAAIALDVLLLELEARDSENYRELRAIQQRALDTRDAASQTIFSCEAWSRAYAAAAVARLILGEETPR